MGKHKKTHMTSHLEDENEDVNADATANAKMKIVSENANSLAATWENLNK
jgi:hypothetical protein